MKKKRTKKMKKKKEKKTKSQKERYGMEIIVQHML